MSIPIEMQSRLLKTQNAITFCMHSEKMHIFYLRECEQSRQLVVVEEDLLTNGVVNTFVVPKGRNIEATGYILQFSRRSGYLMLSYPPCRFVIWNVNTQDTLLFTETRGKNPYFISTFSFNDSSSVLFFTAIGQRNIYCCCLVEDQYNYSFSKYTKLQIPKKIAVFDLKSQPNDKKIVAACSDGFIRIWNSGSLSQLKGLVDPQASQGGNEIAAEGSEYILSKSFFLCVEFSSEGQKMLAGTNYGQVYIFDSRSLGNKHLTLASVSASTFPILSCKWLNYNGSATQKSQHFIAYTSEVTLTLFKYTFQGNLPDLATGKQLAAPQKASAKINKVNDIYNQKTSIQISEYYGVNMAFERFLQIHDFGNIIAIHSLKTKGITFSQQMKSSFDHTAKIFMLWDRSEDKIDFPIISNQVPYINIQELLPNNKKQVVVQRQIFAAESMEVKLVATVLGTVRTVASLKAILSTTSEDTKFLGIQARPLKMGYHPKSKYLLSYKQEEQFYTTSFSASLEKSQEESLREEQIENYLATRNRQALFLGPLTCCSPPVIYLLESLDALTLDCHLDFIDSQLKEFLLSNGYRDANGDELSRKYDLTQKVARIFPTPFRNRFTVIHTLNSENKLHFSKNRVKSNSVLDFDILQDYSLTFALSDSILDVIWYFDSERDENQTIGAVICRDKICFIDSYLKIIRTIKVCKPSSCNVVHSARWFGPVLFYITRTHIHYLCVDGTTNPVISLDSIESKQCIAQIMIDRIVLASKPSIKRKQQPSTLEFKTKVFSPVEPLICGELAMAEFQKREIKENEISQIVQVYATSSISPTLISKLQKSRLNHLAYFYIYNSENKQFPCTQKIKILEQMLKTDGILDLIFPNKSLSKDTDAVEILKKLQNNPKSVGEVSSLKYLSQYYLLIGEFERALLVFHLLQDFNKIFLIAKATNIQPLMDIFSSSFLQTKLATNLHPMERYIIAQSISEEERPSVVPNKFNSIEQFITSDKFAYNIINNFETASISIRSPEVLKEIESIDPEIASFLKKLISRKDIVQSSLAFGENQYSQVFFDKPDEDDEETAINLVSVEPLHPDSLIAYLGTHSNFEEASRMKQGGQSGVGGIGGNNQQQVGDEAGDEEGEQDENKDILILWRFDEGKGKSIGDLSNQEIEGEIFSESAINFDKSWVSLEGISPLETEDIWGKKVPSQCSIIFDGSLSGVKTVSEKWCNKQKKMKEFTMEMWVKSRSGEGSLFRFVGGNETSLNVKISGFEVQVQVKETQLKLVQYKEEDSNNNNNNEENKNVVSNSSPICKLENNTWNHLGVQLEEGGKVNIFINCKDLFVSEEEVEGNIFEMAKNKAIVLGSPQFRGEITEFRLRKEKLPLSQLRDQYKTPLPIVSEKKKQIKFKVKKDDSNQPNSTPNILKQLYFPPLIEDNSNAFEENAQPVTQTKVIKRQETQPQPFAFSMPPIVADEVPSQQPKKQNENKGGFSFGMPTIIKDDEYEIKNNDDNEEKPSTTNQGDNNKDQNKNNFDDFSAFGTFTGAPSNNQIGNNAFSQFQSYSGQPSKDFSDPFSNFGIKSKKENKEEDSGFGGFGDDPESAFGMFNSGQDKKDSGFKGQGGSDFDYFNKPSGGDGGDAFGAGFDQQKGLGSFSNFNIKPSDKSDK